MSSFFWFLLFLSVPILVHLFNFRRSKKFLFTNVKLIQTASTETKSKTRLKHYLILGSRISLLSFLIVAFIYSNYEDKIDSNSTKDHYVESIYFDNSLSSTGDEISDNLEVLNEIVGALSYSSGRLLTNDFSSFSNHIRTQNELVDEIFNITSAYSERKLTQVLERLKGSSKVYLITDFQSSTLDDLSFILKDSSTSYHLIVNEFKGLSNVFMDSVWIERDIDDYSLNLLKCKLDFNSMFEDGNVVTRLLDRSGKQISSVVTNSKNDQVITFSLPRNSSDLFLKIQISGDELEFDNEFFLVLEAERLPRILLLSNEHNTYLANVFSNSDLFDLSISAIDQIDYELIEDADLIILNEFESLPEGLVKQNILSSTFLIIPSDSIDIENYETELGEELLKYVGNDFQEISLGAGNKLTEEVFSNLSPGTSLPKARTKFGFRSSHYPILKDREGKTLLGKSLSQEIYIYGTPMNDDFTELPNHAFFLPMMYKISETSLLSDSRIYFEPNDLIALPFKIEETPPRIVSSNVEIIPEFSQTGQSSILVIPDNLPPGFYQVVQGEDTIASFGLNISKSESKIPDNSFDQLSSFFDGVNHVQVVSGTSESIGELIEESSKEDIWKYALILTLIFIATETLFHRYLK